jgi:predicted permease
VWPHARDAELEEELQVHVALAEEDLRRSGGTGHQVTRTTRLCTGGVTQAMEALRDQRGLPWLRDALQDIRYSVRALRRSPSFTLGVLAAVTLGIGANTAIFSVINTILLRPPPYPEYDRVVAFTTETQAGPLIGGSPAMFGLWRRQTQAFQDVSGYRHSVTNVMGDPAEQVGLTQASVDFFRLLGMRFGLGREFTPDEDRPGGAQVAIISDAFWKRRFNADPTVLGQRIHLSSGWHEIVGVLATGFRTETDPPIDVWIPHQLDTDRGDHSYRFTMTGRLRSGVTLEAARAQLALATEEFRDLFPGQLDPQDRFGLAEVHEALIGNVRPSLYVLAGAVVFLLLIACANVANLLLARATVRGREMVIRAAIGAGRTRLIRQLLTESVVLAVLGGICGLLFGHVAIRGMLAINSGNLPRLGPSAAYVMMDWRLVTFTLTLSVITGIVFGMAPAFSTSQRDLIGGLKDAGRSGTSASGHRLRALLVISEIALSVVLLVGAALLVRSFVKLRAVDPGFDPSNVLTARMSMTDPRFAATAEVARIVRDGLEQVTAVPGVTVAAASCCIPLEGGFGFPFVIPGRPLTGSAHGGATWRPVSSQFFATLRIPIRRGRAFTDRDNESAAPVVMISETMARRFWPDSDPVGGQIRITGRDAALEKTRVIVGIAADVHDGGLAREPVPTMYVPLAQVPDAVTQRIMRFTPLAWLVRTERPPQTLGHEIQRALNGSTGLPVATLRSMDQVVIRSTAGSDFNTQVLTSFAGLAILLAAVGVYGVLAYGVEQRRREIGIRLALGASAISMRNMIVAQGLRVAAIGVGVGLAAAWALSQVLARFLFGVTARDPMTFVVVPALIIAIALIGAWLPARRAAKIAPSVALRSE